MKAAGTLALFALLLSCPPRLAGQERDGTVALPGQFRLDLTGEYLRVDSRFGDDDPWGTNGLLDRTRLTAVVEPADRFDAFLAATGGPATEADGGSLNVGALELDGVVAVRHLPIRIGLGLLRGVEVGVSLPVVRTQRLVRRFDVDAGNLGLNPNAIDNAARLAGLGQAGERMGSSALLPVAGTMAGDLLQARALAATGQTLELPATALDAAALRELFQFERAPYDAGTWDLGDLEADVRIQLISSFSGLYPPPVTTSNYRLTIVGGYRIASPFKPAVSTAPQAPTSGTVGYSGPHAGAVVDLWSGQLWTTVGARGAWLSRDEGDVVTPVDLELRPGSDLAMDPYLGRGVDAWLVPRVRITREISLGAIVEGRFVSGAADVGSTDDGGRKIVSTGLSLRFSSLAGIAAGEEMRPIDASLGFTRPISGGDGGQRISRAFLQVTLLPRFWGGAAEDPPPPAPPSP